MKFPLRNYQVRGIDQILAQYRNGHRAVLYVLPCGGGKTVMFDTIAMRAAAKGNRTLILVHRRELVRQASDTMTAMGLHHGIIAAGEPFTDAMVQVASVQTLVRRLDKIPWRPKLIVVDEAHHSIRNSTWGKVIDHYLEDAHVLGVTATPERLSGEGLGIDHHGFFSSMVIGPQPEELISGGYLVKPVVYSAPIGADMSGLHTRMGDTIAAEQEERLNKPVYTGNAVAHYRKHCDGAPAIAFCSTVKHAEDLAEGFRQGGYSAASVDGKMKYEIQAERIADLGNNRLNVLTSCELISEGVDVPVVKAGILMRHTKSLGLYIQQSCRPLRPAPGKDHAIILDHVGNCMQHGLPDFEREWSLDAKKRSQRKATDEKDIQVKQCKECHYVFMAGPSECPKCGALLPVQQREIEEVDGELVQISAAMARRAMKQEQAQAHSLQELIDLGRHRGYKNPFAWARFIYDARQRKGGGQHRHG